MVTNMNVYEQKTIGERIAGNSYVGRGIVAGKSVNGKYAVTAYFIMGRSENSRNRIFELFENGMRTKALDESKLSDPSLIIYNPFLKYGDIDIITNGDQTNTIYDFVVSDPDDAFAFEEALMTREFEPDHPNYTPRISGIANYYFPRNTFNYKLSILKSANGDPSVCERFFYNYAPRKGIGHFIHTYKCDGNPIPSFYGEPEEVELPNSGEELAQILWSNLNCDNKVSLYVREIPLDGSEPKEIVINKNV